jgi:polysaccharide export outer membrane protein
MFMDRRLIIPSAAVAAGLLIAAPWAVAGGARPPAGNFPNIGYATWTDDEPQYRLYPGDELEIVAPSAPELNRVVTVQPDGRITMPLIPPVMAADRSAPELEAALAKAYASQLLEPYVNVSVKAAGPLKVFVAGEVDKPGVYDMPGDIDALRAIIEAGGFKTSARQSQVVIIRRGPGGRAMMRTVDLKLALKDPARADLVPLRRFDIIYVPRTGLADAGVFVQHIRDLIPGQVGFTYAVGAQSVAAVAP